MDPVKHPDDGRRIWHATRPNLRLGEAEGLTIVAAADERRDRFASQPLYVVEVLSTASPETVSVRYGPLGGHLPPKQVEAPRWRRLGDFVKEHEGIDITRSLVTPGVSWGGQRLTWTAWAMLAAVAISIVLALVLRPGLGDLALLAVPLITLAAGVAPRRQRATETVIRRGGKRQYTREHVLMRLTEMPSTPALRELALGSVSAPADRRAAAERVEDVKAAYGALRTDLVYRIENSALFDPAVAETGEFTLLLVKWDEQHAQLGADEAAALARELQLAFDAARAKAEALGVGHLPSTARPAARRAIKAAHTARRAATDGERTAAASQVNRILASIQLYYLPEPDEVRQQLGGAQPQLEG